MRRIWLIGAFVVVVAVAIAVSWRDLRSARADRPHGGAAATDVPDPGAAADGDAPQPHAVDWRLHGRVDDEHGNAIAGATVRVVHVVGSIADAATPMAIVFTTASKPDGSFTVDPRAGMEDAYAQAEADGYARTTIDLLDYYTEDAPLRIVLRGEPGEVRGRVLDDESGEALVGTSVSYWFSDNGSGGRVATNEKGEFTISHAPAGDVYVGAASVGFLPRRVWRELGAGESVELLLEMQRGMQLAGVVRADGAPLAGAELWLASWPRRRVVTDREGAFSVPWDLAAEDLLYVQAAGRVRRNIDLEDLDDDDVPLEIDLPAAAIVTGRVVDENDRPVHGASVAVLSFDDPVIEVLTGADGVFRIDHIPPEADTVIGLFVRAPGFVPAESKDVAIDRAGERDAGTIRLVRSASRPQR